MWSNAAEGAFDRGHWGQIARCLSISEGFFVATIGSIECFSGVCWLHSMSDGLIREIDGSSIALE